MFHGWLSSWVLQWVLVSFLFELPWFPAGVDDFRQVWLGFSADFGGLFFFFFFFFRLLVVMRLWVWVCDFGG